MRISDWSSDVCSSDLDILKGLIEGEESVDIIVARGHDRDLVNRVWRMLELAAYKRRPACPGVKITRRAFGRARRYPITNAFRGPACAGGARCLAPPDHTPHPPTPHRPAPPRHPRGSDE